MNLSLHKALRALWMPFQRRRAETEVAPADDSSEEVPGEEGPGDRLFALEAQVRAIGLASEELRRELLAGPRPEQADFAHLIRQRLVRARDLRFKAALLQAEIRRGAARGEEPPVAPPAQEAHLELQLEVERLLGSEEIGCHPARDRLQAALAALIAPDPERRREAVRLLADLRMSVAAGALREAMRLEDDELRLECLKVLAGLNARAEASVLWSLLDTANYKVRLEALRALYNQRTPNDQQYLLQACLASLADPASEVRKVAAVLLGWLDCPEASPALVCSLRDESQEVRRAAVEALGKLGVYGPVYTLIRTLEDGDGRVRAAAKFALERILGVPLAIEVDQAAWVLHREVEALINWWDGARLGGAPFKLPALGAAQLRAIPAVGRESGNAEERIR